MKRKFLIGIIVLLSITEPGNAQSGVYYPMPDSNATWCEQYTYGLWPITDYYELSIGGDTIIGSHTYHKLYRTGISVYVTQFANFYHVYSGAFRQDTSQRQVFFMPVAENTEGILYDFSLSVGDTMPLLWTTGLPILSIDSVLVGSTYRNRFWLDCSNLTTSPAYAVEGVGSNFGFYLIYMQGVESGSQLQLFSQNQQPVFLPDTNVQCQFVAGQNELPEIESVIISPNPNSGICVINFAFAEQKDVRVELTDLSGRVLTMIDQKNVTSFRQELGSEELSNGVYFVNITTQDGVVTRKIVVQK